MDLHNGNIRVFSEGEGTGCIFTVDLPMTRMIETPVAPNPYRAMRERVSSSLSRLNRSVESAPPAYVISSLPLSVQPPSAVTTLPEPELPGGPLPELPLSDVDQDDMNTRRQSLQVMTKVHRQISVPIPHRNSNELTVRPVPTAAAVVAPPPGPRVRVPSHDVSSPPPRSSPPSSSKPIPPPSRRRLPSLEVPTRMIPSSPVATTGTSIARVAVMSDTDAQQPQPPQDPPLQPQPPPDPVYHVLVVDDSAMTRKMLLKTLRAKGHTCEEAEDGQIAVEKVKKKLAATGTEPLHDVVLMDFGKI